MLQQRLGGHSLGAWVASSEFGGALLEVLNLNFGVAQQGGGIFDNGLKGVAGETETAVFGKAIDDESFKVMVAISKVRTKDDCPVTPVQMKSVKIEGI